MRRLAPLLLLLALAAPAQAWNPHGHRVVSAIAYRRLTPPVRARVASLLSIHPGHAHWVAGASPSERELVAFMRASNWADDIREMPDYVRDPPGTISLTPRLGFRDRHRHEHWHYTNKPFSPDGSRLRPSATPNVQTQIAFLRRSLASRVSDEQKSYDLVWLLHLVGDIHQPLHTIARFTRQQPDGDRGGTWITLSPDPRDHLHGFWDRAGGEGAGNRDAVAAAERLRPAPEALASVTDEAVWVDEGWQEARRSVYVPPIGPGQGPFTLSDAYRRRARQVAEFRMALAGARLARVLNEALR